MGRQIDFLFRNMAIEIQKSGQIPDVLKGTRAEKIINGILKSEGEKGK
jgi:hypothetical protein